MATLGSGYSGGMRSSDAVAVATPGFRTLMTGVWVTPDCSSLFSPNNTRPATTSAVAAVFPSRTGPLKSSLSHAGCSLVMP